MYLAGGVAQLIPQPREISASEAVSSVRKLAKRPYARTAVLGSCATVVAFVIGTITPAISAVVAGITALVCLRPTFHASVQEGVRQVAGVLLGAGVSGFLVHSFGFTPITFFITIFLGYLLAWVMKLGEEGAVTIGVTVVIVLVDFTAETVENRLFGVLVGVVCAMVFSYFARPGRPTDRVLDDLFSVSQDLSALLTRIGSDLLKTGGAVSRKSAESWGRRADQQVRRLVGIRASAEDALRGAKWSPWINRDEASVVLRQVMVIRQFALTVNAICRDLADAAVSGTTLPENIATAFADSLTAAALALEEQATISMDQPAELLASDSDAMRALKVSRDLVIQRMRALDDTRPIVLSGSLVQDAEQLGKILSSED